MTQLVLEASAAIRLLTTHRAEVGSVLRDRIGAGDRLLVGPTFWIGVIDALAARHQPDAIVEAIYELEQLGIETVEVGRPFVLAIVDAVGRGLDANAAAALVLAESADAKVLTASPDLAAVAGERAILVGRRRRGRARRPGRSWARWKGAAAYLRELRASLG